MLVWRGKRVLDSSRFVGRPNGTWFFEGCVAVASLWVGRDGRISRLLYKSVGIVSKENNITKTNAIVIASYVSGYRLCTSLVSGT